MLQGNYWHAYYDAETIERSDRLRQEFFVETADHQLHVDAYLRPTSDAPVVFLTHGEGGYSRLFVGAALALHGCGISVLVLDQRGHGLSTGPSGDFTLAQLTQDVLDAAHWAHRSFQRPLFLGGIHQGSGLAYRASVLGAPVVGLIFHELYDLSASEDAPDILNLPGGPYIAGAVARALLAVFPRARLPYDRLVGFDGMLDERDNNSYKVWQRDPNPARSVSARYAASLFSTPMDVPYEANALPALVINPMRDRMIDPHITQRNFKRLGGPKTYARLDYGHWSMTNAFSYQWAGEIALWIRGLVQY